ncbi:MAG: flagellar assembly protein FliX [Acetobacteraceae bacterium]
MVKIVGLGAPAVPPARAASRGGGVSRFRVPQEASETAASSEAAPLEGVSIAPSLLALQETIAAGERDARARAQAEAILDELAALQLGLLAGRLPEARIRALAALAHAGERAADPALAAIAAEIGVRAAVELARLDAARRPARQD